MYQILVHAHSITRWVVLVLLVLAIVNSFSVWQKKRGLSAADMKKNLFAMASMHLQVILGLVLFVQSPKASSTFFTKVHLPMMILAAVLITIGYSWSKRTTDNRQGVIAFAFYLVALISLFVGIPWPWMNYGASWF